MKPASLFLLFAMLLGACATTAPAPDATARLSPEEIADCDRRAREATRFGVGEAPLTNSPFSSASQWIFAPDRASFDQMLRDSQYRRCLEDKAAGPATGRPR